MQSFILHIDMNSYFASVEQQANPLYRWKPLGVCAYLGANGCIIASSKEAKKIGIKTGCSIRDAKKIFPKIILVENEPAKYRSTTEKIFSIFTEYTDRIEPYSIDEAFLDLTGYISNYDDGLKLILEIRQRIKQEVGDWLTCSAGLSWTRFLAKFASDITASDSYLIIDSAQKQEEVFNSVKMTEAWGIKERTKVRLNRLGIYSLLDLKRYPVANLLRAFGKHGYYLWANANGIEIEGVRTEEEILPKSIGHSYCIPWHTNDRQYISSIMRKLCEKTGRRLREKNMEAMGIHAGYFLEHGGGYFGNRRTNAPLFTTDEIYKAAMAIVDERYPSSGVYMLAISVTHLRECSGQQTLFAKRERGISLSNALDKLNGRYGDSTVISGSMVDVADNAQDRIGFRKSVGVVSKIDGLRYEGES